MLDKGLPMLEVNNKASDLGSTDVVDIRIKAIFC